MEIFALFMLLLNFRLLGLADYPTKGPQHAPHGNIGPLGADGIFLGFSWSSNPLIVGTKDGIVTARLATRKPESDRWLPEPSRTSRVSLGNGEFERIKHLFTSMLEHPSAGARLLKQLLRYLELFGSISRI